MHADLDDRRSSYDTADSNLTSSSILKMDSQMDDVQPSAQPIPGSYYCSICGDILADLSAFKAHIEGPQERYSHGFEDCEACKKKGIIRTFYTGDSGRAQFPMSSLTQHKNKYHPAKPSTSNFHCQQCSSFFATSNELLAHEELDHKKNELRIHPCKVCQDQGVLTTFATLKNMRRHVSLYHDFQIEKLDQPEDEKFGCPACEMEGFKLMEKSFKVERQLHLHLRKVHGVCVPEEQEIAAMVEGVVNQTGNQEWMYSNPNIGRLGL